MTKKPIDHSKIRERMLAKYEAKEYLFHYLPCLVPAWEPFIDQIIELVENWNSECAENHRLRIFQMKEKFGQFVVYLEPENENGEGEVPDSIRDEVNKIANEAMKTCLVCCQKKTQTVVESRLQWRCLDHWDQKSRWKVRTC